MEHAKPKVIIDMAEYQELASKVDLFSIIDKLKIDLEVAMNTLKLIAREDEDVQGNIFPVMRWKSMCQLAEKTLNYLNGSINEIPQELLK